MNMKKIFLQSVHAGFLLTLLSGPALTKCADVMLQEPAAHTLPLQPMDQPSETLHPVVEPVVMPSQEPESASSSGIDATYAVKNLLSSIMETFPDLSIQEAFGKSALLGIIAETDVQFRMYGSFAIEPDPNIPGRTMRVFDTNTALNKTARSMFDFLDGKLRPTALASNPFVGLDGNILAKMMLILRKDGVQGLIDALEKPTPSKKKTRGKKGQKAPHELEERSLLDEWWESYRSSGVKGVFTQKSKFVAKILGRRTKDDSQDKEDSHPFIELLKEFAAEAVIEAGTIDQVQAYKQKEELSKILMTFLYLKDQKEKAIGESHAVKDYYTALLGKYFETEQYTREELEEIEKILLGQDSPTHIMNKDAKGLEDTIVYLAYSKTSNVAFLETPFGNYRSPEKSFPYCAEATVRSIMNSLLYNPVIGKLDVDMLPPTIPMNAKFQDFIEKYPDPTVENYYGNSLKEWLDLVSGLDGVVYKHEAGKDAYEISASAGPKNLIAVVNHVFGTHADSFETLGTALEVKDDNGAVIRGVSFTPNESGFNLKVTDRQELIINAKVASKVDTGHASFAIKTNGIDLENLIFLRTISEISIFSHQNLYEMIFFSSTLDTEINFEFHSPLLIAIIDYPEIAKIMIALGADPNFKAGYIKTPLELAIFKKNDALTYDLLNHGAIVTEKALRYACNSTSLVLVKKLLLLIEEQNVSIDFNTILFNEKSILYTMITTAFTDKTYFSIVRYLIEHGAVLNDREKSIYILMLTLIKNENLDILDYLITNNIIPPNLVSTIGYCFSLLFMAIEASQFSTAELLIKHGATITEQELLLLDQEKRAIALEIIQKEEAKKAAMPTTMSDIEPEKAEAAEAAIELAEDVEQNLAHEQEMLEQESEVFL